jgi:hypothetical protein
VTQEEFDRERKQKEAGGVEFVDVKSPGGTPVRVFADGTAYAMDGLGGRWERFGYGATWDFDAPGGTTTYAGNPKDSAWLEEAFRSIPSANPDKLRR